MGTSFTPRAPWYGRLPDQDDQTDVEPGHVEPRRGFLRRLAGVAGRCLWIGVILALPAAIAVDFARRETPPPPVVTDADLHAFVIRPDDLPSGYALTSRTLPGADDLASYFNDPGRVQGLLTTWQREGSAATLLTNDGPPQAREPWQAASAVERYPDAAHAAMRWKGRGALYGDWKAEPRAVRSVRGPHVGDQSAASRMEITDQAGRDLVVYSVVFRNGPVVADITTTSFRHKDDRGRQAFRLARLVNERVESQVRPDIRGDALNQPLSLKFVDSVKDGWQDLREDARSADVAEVIARLEEARDAINRTAELMR